MKKGQLERRADAESRAIVEAPTDFSGVPIVIHDYPTWIEIVPEPDVFGRPIQRVWRVIVTPFRAIAVGFLHITATWYAFALVVTSVVTVLVAWYTQ